MDVDNGIWAIYGAREGTYKTMCTNWDYVNVRDFETLNSMWEETYSKISLKNFSKIKELGETLSYPTDIRSMVR